MSTIEDRIREALDRNGVGYQQVVEVDPVENDYLVTGAKKIELVKTAPKPNPLPKMEGHSIPVGKSIIRRLEDLADSDFARYMRVGTDWLDARVEGICECLAVMKNTSRGVEYEAVSDRYQNNITVGNPRPGAGQPSFDNG